MILIVDNYDSFTFNLVQMVAGAGETVEVVRNDAAGAEELLARRPLGIVVSPGPGRPEAAGICVELIRRAAPVPLLGVCLGHQALAVACGAVVGRAGRQMHGKTSRVRHRDDGIFDGLVTRIFRVDLKLPRELVHVLLVRAVWPRGDTNSTFLL